MEGKLAFILLTIGLILFLIGPFSLKNGSLLRFILA